MAAKTSDRPVTVVPRAHGRGLDAPAGYRADHGARLSLPTWVPSWAVGEQNLGPNLDLLDNETPGWRVPAATAAGCPADRRRCGAWDTRAQEAPNGPGTDPPRR
ncbi:hypothetical protein Sliba_48150 [Streptomyces nigrescens]|uniref:Uncharacterized protein n=1 Tax=Streptomyces nigrescens TaxID=1920 RepID=A0A640TN71_STRNI|nr:hypothetical protein Sliba_48150 [Streptomyces libani subsp. libani]GGV94170.1 hypothetical protein GCM10010500_31090 [Streptomyces libani subsp. libani]